MNEDRKVISVVAAIIVRDGRVFATQRGYGEWKDWWEFPGGKVEPGEEPREALRREIREELDTDIEVGEWLTTVEYDYPKFHLSMRCYACRVLSGQLTLLEHEASRWLTSGQLRTVQWLPADEAILPALEEGGHPQAVALVGEHGGVCCPATEILARMHQHHEEAFNHADVVDEYDSLFHSNNLC